MAWTSCGSSYKTRSAITCTTSGWTASSTKTPLKITTPPTVVYWEVVSSGAFVCKYNKLHELKPLWFIFCAWDSPALYSKRPGNSHITAKSLGRCLVTCHSFYLQRWNSLIIAGYDASREIHNVDVNAQGRISPCTNGKQKLTKKNCKMEKWA